MSKLKSLAQGEGELKPTFEIIRYSLGRNGAEKQYKTWSSIFNTLSSYPAGIIIIRLRLRDMELVFVPLMVLQGIGTIIIMR